MSNEILQSVDEILSQSEIPDRHTFFQLKNFIIGKEYTVQGKLWQVVRELKSRRENIEALELQIADMNDNVELVEIKIANLNQSSTQQEVVIQVRKLEREKYSLKRNIDKLQSKLKYILEEVSYLKTAFETLNKVEKMKPLDDVTAQKQYWNEKLSTHLNLKLLLKNPLDVDFVNTILSLDDDAPVKVHMAAILDKVQKNMIEERDRQKVIKHQMIGSKGE